MIMKHYDLWVCKCNVLNYTRSTFFSSMFMNHGNYSRDVERVVSTDLESVRLAGSYDVW